KGHDELVVAQLDRAGIGDRDAHHLVLGADGVADRGPDGGHAVDVVGRGDGDRGLGRRRGRVGDRDGGVGAALGVVVADGRGRVIARGPLRVRSALGRRRGLGRRRRSGGRGVRRRERRRGRGRRGRLGGRGGRGRRGRRGRGGRRRR